MMPDPSYLIISAPTARLLARGLASTAASLLCGAILWGCASAPPAAAPAAMPLAAAVPPHQAAPEASQRQTVEEQLADLNLRVAALGTQPRLGKSDLLSISVYDEADLSLENIPVRPDGLISFPLVGDVQAEGQTVDELTADITERLGQYLLAPKVTVVVQQFNSLNYTVAGEVVKPGVYPLQTDVSLVDAIAKAGGLNKGQYRASSVELADLTHAFVSRNGQVLPVDFVRLLRQGDMRFNIQLQPGDYINIPSGLSKEIYIIGEVKAPALFAFREEMPLSRTLAMAEGFTADADKSRIHVVRGSLSNPTLIVTDFNKIITGQAQDVQLEPGDIVFVPTTGLATWARMLNQIVPTIQALQTGIILQQGVSSAKG
jgi:polysaccharide export outer membrane protein